MMYHLGTVHSERHPAQPLPDDLVKAMNITRFEYEQLGVQMISVSSPSEEGLAEEPRFDDGTSMAMKRKSHSGPSEQRQSKRLKLMA